MQVQSGKAFGICAGGFLLLTHRGNRRPYIGSCGQIGRVRPDYRLPVIAKELIAGVQPRQDRIYERCKSFVLVL